MAERRMFSKSIVGSDLFIDMPLTTQALYFHLGMYADDEGFVGSPRKIQRMIACSDDDLKLLIAKGFVIPFESGVVVLTHWRMQNSVPKDRFKHTIYKDERQQLGLDCNSGYLLNTGYGYNNDTECKQIVSNLDTQVSSGEISQVQVSPVKSSEVQSRETPYIIGGKKPPVRKQFTPPTLAEVRDYCNQRANGIDPQYFLDYYTANGWKVGKNAMKDWKAAVRTWERNGVVRSQATAKPKQAKRTEENAVLEAVMNGEVIL